MSDSHDVQEVEQKLLLLASSLKQCQYIVPAIINSRLSHTGSFDALFIQTNMNAAMLVIYFISNCDCSLQVSKTCAAVVMMMIMFLFLNHPFLILLQLFFSPTSPFSFFFFFFFLNIPHHVHIIQIMEDVSRFTVLLYLQLGPDTIDFRKRGLSYTLLQIPSH